MNASVAVYSPPRTYPIPQAVVAEAVQGFRWARAYDVDVPEAYQYTAAMLASGGSVDLVELSRLNRMHSQVDTPTGWSAGEPGYPCRERVLSALAGGTCSLEWSEKVLSSIEAEEISRNEEILASIGYDTDRFHYIGLCAAVNPDVVTSLVRTSGSEWESWNPQTREWDSTDFASVSGHEAVIPDSRMTAELVAALHNDEKLLLNYADPVAFLPSEPVMASVAPNDVEAETFYAVVDEIDTSAVIAALRVTPGPRVEIRENGGWVHDQEYQDWFLDADPPALVAMGAEEIRSNVFAQIDSLQNQLVVTAVAKATELESSTTDPESTIRVADDLIEKLDEIKQLRVNTQDYDPDELRDLHKSVMRSLGYDDLAIRQSQEILASATTEDDVEAAYEPERERRIALRSAMADVDELIDLRTRVARFYTMDELRELGRRVLAHETIDNASLVAAPQGGWDRNRGNAERLRRYWLHGRGAAKIRWGTHGDWRRCYRQLFKHMGPRAAGYCQLRHKEATNLWTGDRAHRRGIDTLKASGEGADSTNSEAHTGVMIALYPSPDVAKKIALEGGEPPEELHVTLAFLGDSSDMDPGVEQKLIDRITEWAPTQDVHEGVYAGKGLFVGEGIPEGSVTYLSPDINTLPSFRQRLIELIERDNLVTTDSTHGFTPHTTLAYGDRLADVVVEQVPVRFEQISVVWGSSRTDITLGDD